MEAYVSIEAQTMKVDLDLAEFFEAYFDARDPCSVQSVEMAMVKCHDFMMLITREVIDEMQPSHRRMIALALRDQAERFDAQAGGEE